MREQLSSFENYHGNKYYTPVVSTIEAIKSLFAMHEEYSGKEFLAKINAKTEELFEHFSELSQIHNNDIDKLLPIVLDFIQNLYSDFGVTYFYNLSPDVSYDEYNDYSTGQQILNNIFDGKVYINKHCLIKEDYIMGGSCHHRSLIIKKIFDRLNLEGVKCIINKDIEGWHSFVSLEYGARTWLIDMLPQTKPLLDQQLYVLDESAIQKFGTGTHNAVLNPDLEPIYQFENSDTYKKSILNKIDYKTINLWINTVRIEITKQQIVYQYRDFDTREKTIRQSIKLSKPIGEYSKLELLAHIFAGVKPIGTPNILPLVSKKISEEMLFSIFK